MGKKNFGGLQAEITLFARLLRGDRLTFAIICRELGIQRAAGLRHLKRLGSLPGALRETVGRDQTVRLANLVPREPTAAADVAAACLMSSLASTLKDTSLKSPLERIRARIVASSKRARHATDLDRKFWFVVRGGEAALPRRENELAEIIDAILESRAIEFDYTHFDGGQERLCVKPLTFALHEHQFYVISVRADGRFYPYRFSRLSKIRLRAKFRYPERTDYDLDVLFQNVFGIFLAEAKPIEDVQVRLSPDWRHYVESHRWHATQTHTIGPDHSAVLRLRVRPCPELKRWILWFGPDAEVIGPADLRSETAERLMRAAMNYGARKRVARRMRRSTS